MVNMILLPLFGICNKMSKEEGKQRSDELDIFIFGNLFAVMAEQTQILLIDHPKACSYLFVIGNAFRIETFDDTFDNIGYFGLFLRYHFKITNFDKGSSRGYKGYLIVFHIIEKFISNFDNSLIAILFTIEVHSKEHLMVGLNEVEDTHYLNNSMGGNMVDYCSILNGGHDEFFSAFGFHMG